MNAVVENRRVKVVELRPRMKNIDIKFKLIEKGEPKEVFSKHNQEPHRVASARVADSTGIVTMPLWDETIDRLEEGKTYVLENGFTGIYRGSLRLKVGRHSEISEAKNAIKDINKYHDKSADRQGYQQRGHYFMG